MIRLSKLYYNISNKSSYIFGLFKYRFLHRYHIIDTRLSPNFYDHDVRILHGMFSILVDFVECDKSWKEFRSQEPKKDFLSKVKYKIKKSYIRFVRKRDVAAGLEYLKWEIGLSSGTLPHWQRSDRQSECAKEIWDLYHWWKYVRPLRLEPDDASGWSIWLKTKGSTKLSAEEAKTELSIINLSNEIEEKYQNEDTKQLIRLINIRDRLWI